MNPSGFWEKFDPNPVSAGYCKAFVGGSTSMAGLVRCSRRATVQGFCRSHAKREGILLPQKNPAAVSLGRRGGLVGGHARAAKLTPAERRESARQAAIARWDRGEKRPPRRRGLALWKEKTLAGKIRELDRARLAALEDPELANLVADQIEDEFRAHRVPRSAPRSFDVGLLGEGGRTLHDVWSLDPMMPDASFVEPLLADVDFFAGIDWDADLDAILRNLYTPTP